MEELIERRRTAKHGAHGRHPGGVEIEGLVERTRFVKHPRHARDLRGVPRDGLIECFASRPISSGHYGRKCNIGHARILQTTSIARKHAGHVGDVRSGPMADIECGVFHDVVHVPKEPLIRALEGGFLGTSPEVDEVQLGRG